MSQTHVGQYCISPNKSYSKSIRQYAKRRTTAQFPSTYYFICITKCNLKNYFTFRGMSMGCKLMVQCQKHAKLSCGKIQITYIYEITFLFLKALTIGI